MSKIPQVKSKEVIMALKRLGFVVVRTEGSHVRLTHSDGRKVTVAQHNRPIFKGTLHSILQQAKITVRELINNL